MLTSLVLCVPAVSAQTAAAPHDDLGALSQAIVSAQLPATASSELPQAPSALLLRSDAAGVNVDDTTLSPVEISSTAGYPFVYASSSSSATGEFSFSSDADQPGEPGVDEDALAQEAQEGARKAPATGQQPKRILGLMPNYRSVSAGTIPPPPTFKQSFKIATRQAFDYSSFVFLGVTTASAYWQDSHPTLDTYNGGDAPFWAYLWRGFLDKTDGTYQSAWILPTLLHEDTRYYALGSGSKWKRLGYAASRVAIARTYSGHQTINLAGLGGKAGAQAVSRTYYPPGATSFGVLATKFAYACARDMGFTVFREFYPDIAIHVLHRNP